MKRKNNDSKWMPWFTAPIVAVDIETVTNAKPSYPAILHRIKDFGLSAVAPITDIALYTPELGSVHFNMRGFDPYTGSMTEEAVQNWKLIAKILQRPDVTIVGHNVLFDLRGIGTQYNAFKNKYRAKHGIAANPVTRWWHLPLGSRVWCTEMIAKRMLLGEQVSRKSGEAGDSFSLIPLAQRLGVEISPATLGVMSFMKEQRAALDAESIRQAMILLPDDHVVWEYIGGWIPSADAYRPIFEKSISKLLQDYVTFDARIAYEIYEKQWQIAQDLAKGDVTLGRFKWKHYPELTRAGKYERSEFAGGHIDFWTRYFRLAANRAAYGIKLNRKYAEEKLREFKESARSSEQAVLLSKDPHDPFPDFENVVSQMLYWKMLLDKAAGTGTFKKDAAESFVFWKPNVNLNPHIYMSAFHFSSFLSEEQKMEWIAWLNRLYPSWKDAQASMPKSEMPVLNIAQFIYESCYGGYDETQALILTKSKMDWLVAYYSTTKSNLLSLAKTYAKKHKVKESVDPLELGKRIYRQKMTNNKRWIPYYLFCVAKAPLPSGEDFLYGEGLLTSACRNAIYDYKKENGEYPQDIQRFVVNFHIKSQGLSYGKKMQDFFLENDEYEEILRPLRKLTYARAQVTRIQELLPHAYLDGYIHSSVRPDTKTGRNASKNPNLQNLAMATKDPNYPSPYPGMFVAARHSQRLLSIDYSNAEVLMGIMIAADNAAAVAAVDNDYHAAVAAVYFKDEWDTADAKRRKVLRSNGKRVTFGTAYGSGPEKTAIMLRSTFAVAKQIIENKKRAFFKTEEAKTKAENNARERMRAGYFPVFAPLWSGERVQVDRMKKFNGVMDIVGYTIWNYFQQGGVTSMLRRWDVLVSEMLEREGAKTIVLQDVHDELVFSADIQEYKETNLFEEVLKLACNIIPTQLRKRTIPEVHFVAEVGPENKDKWGFHPELPYPFPTDEFITQWGKMPLPEGAKEAPSWCGPKHLGWTLEKENEETRRQRMLSEVLGDASSTLVEANGDAWETLENLVFDLLLHDNPEVVNAARSIMKRRAILFESASAGRQLKTTENLPLISLVQVAQELYHKGRTETYPRALKLLWENLQALTVVPEVDAWLTHYTDLFELREM